MKKIIAFLLVVSLTATIAIGGTLAFLTDRDSEANVFTVGNVEIDLKEDFEQDSQLIPGVDIKKEATITNTGINDAYVWMTLAVPSALDVAGSASDNVLHWNVPGAFWEGYNTNQTYIQSAIDAGWLPAGSTGVADDKTWNVDDKVDMYQTTIDGVAYNVYTLLYNSTIEPGETTNIGLCDVYLDDHIDIDPNGDWYHVLGGKVDGPYWNSETNGNPVVYVSAYAMQTDGFGDLDGDGVIDVVDAYKAYNAQWDTDDTLTNGSNGDEWGDPSAAMADTWDGTADTSWYDPANPLTEYEITSAEQLAGLSELVSGNTTFAGVTFTLANDIDLYCEDTSASADGDPVTFRPIGDHSKDGTFEGTFDGNGKTISNLYQNGWDLGYQWGAYGSYGLFGNVNNATIKNLTITGAESYIEGGDVGGVTGSATGTCVFENITIEDSDFATYNNGCGGIIGWSGAGDYTFKNITLGEDMVLAGLWGSFDSSIGGVVGQGEPGATYNFENVDVACRLDCYNDVIASYKYYLYRMTGMLIGRLEETTTIDGSNYPDMSKYNITCQDVTVTYGDWVDYHYCVVAGKTAWRVEPGYAYNGVPADHDHSTCAMHCNELLPFEGLFGGDQYGVRPITEYSGVTVKSNN